jgi:hypothetical protein
VAIAWGPKWRAIDWYQRVWAIAEEAGWRIVMRQGLTAIQLNSDGMILERQRVRGVTQSSKLDSKQQSG